MVEEEEDEEEVLFSGKMANINVDSLERNVYVTQDNQTSSHIIVFTNCKAKESDCRGTGPRLIGRVDSYVYQVDIPLSRMGP